MQVGRETTEDATLVPDTTDDMPEETDEARVDERAEDALTTVETETEAEDAALLPGAELGALDTAMVEDATTEEAAEEIALD